MRGAILAFLSVLLSTLAPAAGVKESWYMMRGKSNMEIRNYKAAIEAYEQAVILNPGNREAQLKLGLAYEAQGLTGKAIAQFDVYLKRFRDNPSIAFKQARYLESERFAYRRADAIRYYRLGLDQRDDAEQRHRLARLLAADKSTLPEAVKEYAILVERNPGNAAIRKEYRSILLWDPRYRKDAIREFERKVAGNPKDVGSRRQLAELLAADGNPARAEALYADLVHERPGDDRLRLEYAKTLAARPSRFDAARGQFEVLLDKEDKYETRVLYANLLATRGGERDRALDEYRTLLERKPGDSETRLRYAGLLGARKGDAGRAVAQYKRVLAAQPRNAEAHAGLARMYAWTGERDKAAHHNKLARRYGHRNAGTRQLEQDLMEGHETRVGAEMTLLSQTGGPFSMGGFMAGLNGQGDPTPFTTVRGTAGMERYWDEKRDVSGPRLQMGVQYRMDGGKRWDVSLGARFLEDAEASLEFDLGYAERRGDWLIAPGLSREYLAHSILSLAGSDEFGKPIGRAAAYTAYCRLQGDLGRWNFLAVPRTGWVEAESATPNFHLALQAEGAFAVLDAGHSGTHGLEAGYGIQVLHFARDHSGFHPTTEEPLAGGYFSPGFHLAQTPHLRYRLRFGDAAEMRLRGGPNWQITSDTSGTATKWGGDAQASVHGTLRREWRWSARLEFLQVASAFNRFQLGMTFHRVF
jgi:tetratricopeptide (TPR) repeat protein